MTARIKVSIPGRGVIDITTDAECDLGELRSLARSAVRWLGPTRPKPPFGFVGAGSAADTELGPLHGENEVTV